jgi:hypothetical protein
MVLRHPSQVAAEVARPVSYRDAQKFRWVTVLIAGLPLAAAGAWSIADLDELPGALLASWYFPFFGTPFSSIGQVEIILPWTVGIVVPGVLPLCLLLFVALVSGVSSYFFHPKRLTVIEQNRAVAISFYGVAPLVLLPLLEIILGAMAAFYRPESASDLADHRGLILALGLGLVTWLSGVMWIQLTLLKRATRGAGGMLTLFGAALPILWSAAGATALVLLPWIAGYLTLLVCSLR